MTMVSSRSIAAAATTLALVFAAGTAIAKPAAAPATAKPAHLPAGFVKVADALKNPGMAFIPGMGTLYVDPKTLPAGPFFGYDKKGKLVNITYMVPLKAITEHKNWMDVGGAAKGMKIDHTDIYSSGAHPGVPEEHLHIVNWLVSPAEAKALGAYPGMLK